jgi:hypothetical protein
MMMEDAKKGIREMTDKKTTQIMIATPMYGGLCNGSYTVGLLTAVMVFSQRGIAMQYAHMMNESLITRARNSLAKDFLASECTHLMFIDADIGFNPGDIPPMLDADKDIICGIYPKKEINWLDVTKAVNDGVPPQQLHHYTGAFVVNLVDGATSAEGNMYTPMEIANGGTGFMLIKREVFEGLIGKVPTYTNDMFTAVDDQTKRDEINEFFATSIDKESGNRLLSEDYHFCKIAREAGFRVWAAPWAHLSHTGTYIFNGMLPRAE